MGHNNQQVSQCEISLYKEMKKKHAIRKSIINLLSAHKIIHIYN